MFEMYLRKLSQAAAVSPAGHFHKLKVLKVKTICSVSASQVKVLGSDSNTILSSIMGWGSNCHVKNIYDADLCILVGHMCDQMLKPIHQNTTTLYL